MGGGPGKASTPPFGREDKNKNKGGNIREKDEGDDQQVQSVRRICG